MAEKSRDDVLKRMLKTPPQPKQKPSTVAADTRGAAKGLNLDNMEDMAGGLRAASEPTRTARQAINKANRAKAKKPR
jgi:hypothetical protein